MTGLENDNKDLSYNANQTDEDGMAPPRKKIYNPVTNTWYEIRQRSSKFGRKGQIRGKRR